MPKRNTYSYLIEVLQYVMQSEHTHFVETFCDLDLPEAEAIEDAFADDDVQHVYKSAKLAYWELLDTGGRYGLVEIDTEKELETEVLFAELTLAEKKLALLQCKTKKAATCH